MTDEKQLKKMTFQEQRQCLVDMVEYVDQVCQKNDIKYSMMFGTLLGAVRHQGFIPWDDDIDLAVLRDDYNKMKKILNESKDKRYIFLDNLDDQKYVSPWAKIIDTKTYILENGQRQSDNYGMFIDIFPYDKHPKSLNFIDYLEKKITYMLLNNFRQPKSKQNNRNLLKIIRNQFANFLGKNRVVKIYDYLNCRNNKNGSNLVASVNVKDYNKTLEIDEFSNLIRMKFETIELNGFKNYDKILTDYFGDYMTLPPENERVTHGIDAYWK